MYESPNEKTKRVLSSDFERGVEIAHAATIRILKTSLWKFLVNIVKANKVECLQNLEEGDNPRFLSDFDDQIIIPKVWGK